MNISMIPEEEYRANWTGGFWLKTFNVRYQKNWIEGFLTGLGITYDEVVANYKEEENAILDTLPCPALFPIEIVKRLAAEALAMFDDDLTVILQNNSHDQHYAVWVQESTGREYPIEDFRVEYSNFVQPSEDEVIVWGITYSFNDCTDKEIARDAFRRVIRSRVKE